MLRLPASLVVLSAGLVMACASGTASRPDGGEGGLLAGAGGATTGMGGEQSGPTGGFGGSPSNGGAPAQSGGSSGDGGAGPGCVDNGIGEPNESEATAYPLVSGAIEDCDGDGSTFAGTLAPGDVDWITYEGSDVFGCVVDPTRAISQSQSGMRMCKFFQCISGDTEVTCPSGTTSATSPGGRAGCCGTMGFGVSGLNCTGTSSDDTDVYIRLDMPNGNASTCNDYTLAYHY
jgi:hypothetical protein